MLATKYLKPSIISNKVLDQSGFLLDITTSKEEETRGKKCDNRKITASKYFKNILQHFC